MLSRALSAGRLARWTLLVGLAWLSLLVGACGPDADAYRQEIETYRQERLNRLEKEDGWLSLVGLVWLDEGPNRFGTDPELEIVLPAGSAPAVAGTLHYDGRTVRIEAGPDVAIGDQPADGRVLADDKSGEPDVVQVGRLTLHILARSGQHGVRIKDPESPARVGFTGIDYYPIDRRYRKVGRFHPYDEPQERQVPTVVGIDQAMFVPGEVEIEIDGESHRLLPLVSDPADTHFFFILRDETSGKGSYGAGRYLYGDLEGGRVVVDFNRAYNPPCAFTPYATCPLPPPENRLSVAIEAGEKDYGQHGG